MIPALPPSMSLQRITELLQSSESRTRLAGRARLSLSQTIRLSLTLLSQRLSYRSVSRRFHLEKGNIHRIFFSFCQRLSALEEVLIRLPAGPSSTANSLTANIPPVAPSQLLSLISSRPRGCRDPGSSLEEREEPAAAAAGWHPHRTGSTGTHMDPNSPTSWEAIRGGINIPY